MRLPILTGEAGPAVIRLLRVAGHAQYLPLSFAPGVDAILGLYLTTTF